MRVMITGAGGFLGQAIASHFHDAGWQVHGVIRALTPPAPLPGVSWHTLPLPHPQLAALIEEQQPHLLVHAAGPAAVGQSMRDPLNDFEQSVHLWAATLDAVRLSGMRQCRVIFLSSAAVYGNAHKLPIAESDPLAPISPYGYHKRFCEQLAEYYSRLYAMPICSVRIFSAYGPGLRRQVLWDLSQKALAGGRIVLHGTGQESRDFIHATDVARGLGWLADRGDFQAGIYNLSSGVSTTIRELAEKLLQALNTNRELSFSGQQRTGDPLYWQADTSRLAALGFQCRKSLDAGLQEYAAWVRQLQAQKM